MELLISPTKKHTPTVISQKFHMVTARLLNKSRGYQAPNFIRVMKAEDEHKIWQPKL